jgi:hypothetical protein
MPIPLSRTEKIQSFPLRLAEMWICGGLSLQYASPLPIRFCAQRCLQIMRCNVGELFQLQVASAHFPFGSPNAATLLASWHTHLLFVGTVQAKL